MPPTAIQPLLATAFVAMLVVADLACASSPYSIYVLNTFPMDRNRSRIDQMASHRSGTPGEVSDYSEFYQPETGVLGWTAGESREEALRRMVDEQVEYLRTTSAMGRVHRSNKICGGNRTTERRIHTVINERNVPYEIPCSGCSQPPHTSTGPYFFYIFEGQPDEALDAPISDTRWTSASVFLHKHVVANRDRAGGIFAMQRSADGTLVIDPAPISKWRDSPVVDFNSLVVACAYEREGDGREELMDVVYHVETLSHPGALGSASSWGMASPDDRETHFRLGDVSVLDKSGKKEGLVRTRDDLNMKLDISWRKWSCCSACCYHGLSRPLCDRMESTQIRRGYVSLFKIRPDRELNMRVQSDAFCATDAQSWPDCTKRLDEALASLGRMLSREPYSTEGVPIFSTFFQRNENMRLAESFLNSLLQYRTDEPPSATSKSDSYPFGNLGFHIDARDCTYEQKEDCTKLVECHEN